MECKEEIQKALWKWAWPHIQRGLTRGLPEWYKNHLLTEAFENPVNADIEPDLNTNSVVCDRNPQKGDTTLNDGILRLPNELT